MWRFLAAAGIGFLIVHLVKMMRLYLVLMEHKIGMFQFVRLYLSTTFVNLVVPFKLGEVFRIFSIYRTTKLWQVGILSVLVDRFFDLFALLCVLLPFDLLKGEGISVITGVLFVVLVVISLLYFFFPSTYLYLNRYIIRYKTSKRSLLLLRGLEITKNWYEYAKNLMQGRFPLIIATSFVGWVAEVVTLSFLSKSQNISFSAQDFATYMSAIFIQNNNPILKTYTLYGAIVIGTVTVVAFTIYLIMQFKNQGRGVSEG